MMDAVTNEDRAALPGFEPDWRFGSAEAAPPRRLYLTSEVRAATGLSRTHMDFYLREGIVRPVARTANGMLLFDDAELETVRSVLRWRAEGAGIKLIRHRLGRDGQGDQGDQSPSS